MQTKPKSKSKYAIYEVRTTQEVYDTRTGRLVDTDTADPFYRVVDTTTGEWEDDFTEYEDAQTYVSNQHNDNN